MTDIGIDTGTARAPGATRQRWRSRSASALIAELLASCGGDALDRATRDEVIEQFTYLLMNDETARTTFLPSVAEYFAVNHLNSIRLNQEGRHRRRRGAQTANAPEAEASTAQETPQETPGVAQETPVEPTPEPSSGAAEVAPAEPTAPTAAVPEEAGASSEPLVSEALIEVAVEAAAQTREARIQAREGVRRSMRMRFLSWTMPIGKPLGECDWNDLETLKARSPVFFGRIQARLTPNGGTVGQVLDEDSLAAMWEA
jgi:hypothetical protein